MAKAEDPIVTVKVEGIDEISAAQRQREAAPLHDFCVELLDKNVERGVTAQTVCAHRFRFDGEWLSSSFSFASVAVGDGAKWVRFLVDRNGREEVVAAFREADVRAVWQTAKEEL